MIGSLPAAFVCFATNPKWVAWRYHQRGSCKPTKLPVNPHDGRFASVSDPATWGTFEQAKARVEAGRLAGVGLVLTADDGLTGADLDGVRDPKTGALKDWVAEIVALGETYIEISPSGTGLRIFWKGKIDRAIKNDNQSVEMYGNGRYLTITGNRLESSPDEICEAPRTRALLLARAGVRNAKSNGKSATAPSPVAPSSAAPTSCHLDTAALHSLDDWVPDLFEGRQKKSRGGYRISSKALGRDHEEDLSITPRGIVDWGVHDMGDPRNGKRTPVELVMEHGHLTREAAFDWLAKKLRRDNSTDILDPADPMPSAKAIIASAFTGKHGRTLQRHRESFQRWDGSCYRSSANEIIDKAIWDILHGAKRRTPQGIARFKPNRSKVADVRTAMAACCLIDERIEPPAWLIDQPDLPPPSELFACANGLLHVPSRTMHPATPNYFGVAASTVMYDESAAPPDQWLTFLDQALGDDEAIATQQEWFGYLLTPDTSQQKILLCVGQRRSGKGTIARVLTALLGKQSVGGPTMSSLGEQFGLESLITKPLAIVSDARIGGRTDKMVIVERLLTISGEDTLSVPRKFLSDWTGKLPTRIIIMTNELPSLTEGSGALLGRFIVLLFPNSFFGREDIGLTNKLLIELPGILNWAIEGYCRLRERGHFIQPKNAQDLIDQIEALGSPVKAFVGQCCEIGPGFEVSIDGLFERYKEWCQDENRRDAGSREWFGRNLNAAVPGLEIVRKGERRERHYVGLRPLCRPPKNDGPL